MQHATEMKDADTASLKRWMCKTLSCPRWHDVLLSKYQINTFKNCKSFQEQATDGDIANKS